MPMTVVETSLMVSGGVVRSMKRNGAARRSIRYTSVTVPVRGKRASRSSGLREHAATYISRTQGPI